MIGNNISDVPKEIVKLVSLQSLRLGLNNFTHFPVNALLNSSLTTLYLNNNLITSLDEFETMNQSNFCAPLSTLNLEHNKIENISNNIQFLSSMKYLRLNNNNLVFLPESIGRLHSLQKLYVSFNNLLVLPKSISQLPALSFFDASHNELEAIPAEWFSVAESHDDDALTELETKPKQNKRQGGGGELPFRIARGDSFEVEEQLVPQFRITQRMSIDDPTRRKRSISYDRKGNHGKMPLSALTDLYIFVYSFL